MGYGSKVTLRHRRALLTQHRTSLAFLALYSVIMMGLTSPLLRTGIRASTVWPENDPAQPIWALAFVAHASNWFHHGGPLFSDAVYFPHGLNLLANTTSFGLAVLFIPVTALLGPLGSFNLIMFLGPILSGATMMWALRRHVASSVFRGIAGLVWGFSPFTLEAFYWGWPNFVVLVTPPLVLWLATEMLHGTYSPRRIGLLLGITISIQITVGAEIAAICVVGVLATILFAGIPYSLTQRRLPGDLTWHKIRGTALWSAVGFTPIGLPLTGFALFGPAHLTKWVWHESFLRTSHSWASLVREPVFTGTWDPLWYPEVPSHFYFGWPALVALVVIVATVRHSLVRTMGLVALVGLWLMRGEDAFLHPLTILWHIPVARNIFSGRFIMFTWFAFAVIVAMGLQKLSATLSNRGITPVVRTGVVFALLVVILYQPAHAVTAAGPWKVQSSRHDLGLSAYAARSTEARVVMTYPGVKSSSSMIQQATENLPIKLVGGWGPQTGFTEKDDRAVSYLLKAQHWFLPVPSRVDLEALNGFLARRSVDAIIIPRHLNFALRRGYLQPYQMVAIVTYMYGAPEKIADSWLWERPHNSSWQLRSPDLTLTNRQWRRCAWGLGRINPDGVPGCIAHALVP